MSNPKYYAAHAWHYSINVWLLGRSSWSSPSSKELHDLGKYPFNQSVRIKLDWIWTMFASYEESIKPVHCPDHKILFRLVSGCCRIAVICSNVEIENFLSINRNATDYHRKQQIHSIVWTSLDVSAANILDNFQLYLQSYWLELSLEYDSRVVVLNYDRRVYTRLVTDEKKIETAAQAAGRC